MIEAIAKDNLSINNPYDYFCLTEPGVWHTVSAISLLRAMRSNMSEEPVMSLRLSTGIIGELDCPAGNSGPKRANEVIVGLGKKGIEGLLELGALPCIVCRPDEKLTVMDHSINRQLVQNADGRIENASDPTWLTSHYDSRRLDWVQLTDLGMSPGRFYTRPGLDPAAVNDIASYFTSTLLRTPDIGYYDEDSPDKFTSYNK